MHFKSISLLPLFLYSPVIDLSTVDQLCVNNAYHVLWEATET